MVYYDECYKIVGILMEVSNQLGYGFNEKTYQKAVALALKKAGYKFTEQLYAPICFEGEIVGKNYFDFLIEDIIVLELKKVIIFLQLI